MNKTAELPVYEIPTPQRNFIRNWGLPRAKVPFEGVAHAPENIIHVWIGKFSLGETISIISPNNDPDKLLTAEVYVGVLRQSELDDLLASTVHPSYAYADLVNHRATGLAEGVQLLQGMIGLPDTETKYWLYGPLGYR